MCVRLRACGLVTRWTGGGGTEPHSRPVAPRGFAVSCRFVLNLWCRVNVRDRRVDEARWPSGRVSGGLRNAAGHSFGRAIWELRNGAFVVRVGCSNFDAKPAGSNVMPFYVVVQARIWAGFIATSTARGMHLFQPEALRSALRHDDDLRGPPLLAARPPAAPPTKEPASKAPTTDAINLTFFHLGIE